MPIRRGMGGLSSGAGGNLFDRAGFFNTANIEELTIATELIFKVPSETYAVTILSATPSAAYELEIPTLSANDSFAVIGLAQTLSNKTLASPKVTTGILDSNGNELFKFTATSSAINELTLANAASGGAPILSATGGDTNIGITLTPKGSGVVTISGGLTVEGTTTTIESTTLTVDDKNIEMGSVDSPSDSTADGGGITLKGATDKTILWDNANDNWTSNQDWNIASGKAFKINDASTLNATTLGSAVVTSSLTTVGALNSGSITSGFGTIDNGSSAITTTGTVTYGSLSDGSITITAFVDEDDMSSDSATLVPTQQSVKAYVDSEGGSMSNFYLEDDDGTEVTVTNGKEVKIIGSGVTTNWTDTSHGSDSDPYDLTITVDAAQTGITSIYATDLIMGEDAQTAIDFGTANEIDFKVDNAARLTLTSGALYPVTNNQIDLGTSSLEFKDAFFDGTVTADAFAGPLTGDVTGNVSGTAATVTTAAQGNITSLGTLTALTVDDVAINGKVVTMTGSTDDTAVFTVGTHGTLTIETTDTAAAAANLQITADGTVDIDSAGVLTLDSGAAINIEPASGSAILLDGTISIDGGAITGVASILQADVKIGEDDQTKIDFETADEIHFYAANVEQVYLADNIFGPQSDSDVDLGTTGVRWKDAFVDSITVTGEVDAVTLDISGNADIDGTTNLDAVDIDGNVQLDGTFTVGVDDTGKDVKFFGASAGAYMEWDESADQLRIMGASADATTSTGKLLLATSLTDINANDVIGKIDFQAPHEAGGTDAITVAASIQAIAQGTFSASVNATDLIFYTGHSEAATEKIRITSQGEIGIGGANYGTDGQVLTSAGAGAAVAWEDAASGGTPAADDIAAGDAAILLTTTSGNITIDAQANDSDIILKGTDGTSDTTFLTIDGSAAGLATFNAGATLGGNLIIPDDGNIGSASDTNSIAISSAGVVTMDQIPVFSAGINVSGGTIAGTLATAAQGNVTSLGTLTALTVDDVVINGKVITMTGSSSDTAVFTVGTHGTLSIVTTDAAAAAANIQITADGTVDIDSAGVLTLDSGAAINIEPAAGSAILLDGTISVDAGVVTGATSITSTAFVGDITGDVTGTADVATVATTVTITDNENTNEDNAIIFTAGGDVDGGNIGLESDGDLIYNPSTGRLTATQLAGTLQTASQTAITGVGTITTGVWNGTAIASGYIAADAITGAKIADDAIDSEHYTNGSIDTAHIADNQITLAKMAGGTDGNIISYDASGDPVAIATGNDGQVLTSTGAGSPPAFEALPSSGKVLQVVQATTGARFTTTSSSLVDITGLTVNITPSSSSSTILILVTLGSIQNAGDGRALATLLRDSTEINLGSSADGIEATIGTNIRSDAGEADNDQYVQFGQSFSYLDSPSTTSQITYKMQTSVGDDGGTTTINTPATQDEYGINVASTIIAMEIGP